jgi:hypothetical protein
MFLTFKQSIGTIVDTNDEWILLEQELKKEGFLKTQTKERRI